MRTYRWFPLYGPGEEDEGKAPIEVDSEEDFIGERERAKERERDSACFGSSATEK